MICPELPHPNNPGSMAPCARQIQSIQDQGVKVEIVDMKGIPKLKYLTILPKLRRFIKKADLIHAHFGYCGWLALLGRSLARRQVPIVMSFMGDDLLGTPHNESGDLKRMSIMTAHWNKRLARRYDRVIVKSKQMAAYLEPAHSEVIPNGVDIELFSPMEKEDACRRIGLDPSSLKVLFPGNPRNPRKGFGLARSVVEVTQQLLGRPIDLVPLWGISPDKVATFMNACNAMLMTSLIEGSPNVVKEALACNQSIIAVPVGDAHEILEGISGCYRTGRDPQEMGKALAAVLSSAERSAGRAAVLARGLTLPQVAQRVIDVYQQALGPAAIDRRNSAETIEVEVYYQGTDTRWAKPTENLVRQQVK